jgi:S-adenosylmethionine uptake transporter
MSAEVPSLTVTLAAALSVTGFSAVMAVLGGLWQPMSGADLGLIGTASVFILGGYLFAVMVMRVGEVSFVAPFRYTGLLWALVLGFLVFGHWPEPVVLLGAAIVVAAGLFTFHRERVADAPGR